MSPTAAVTVLGKYWRVLLDEETRTTWTVVWAGIPEAVDDCALIC